MMVFSPSMRFCSNWCDSMPSTGCKEKSCPQFVDFFFSNLHLFKIFEFFYNFWNSLHCLTVFIVYITFAEIVLEKKNIFVFCFMESIFYFQFTTCKHLQKAKTVEIEYLLQKFVAVFLSHFRIKLLFVFIQFLVFFRANAV